MNLLGSLTSYNCIYLLFALLYLLAMSEIPPLIPFSINKYMSCLK